MFLGLLSPTKDPGQKSPHTLQGNGSIRKTLGNLERQKRKALHETETAVTAGHKQSSSKEKISAIEMKCCRGLLGIDIWKFKEHITRNEVRMRTAQAIGPHVDLLTIVDRRKLK